MLACVAKPTRQPSGSPSARAVTMNIGYSRSPTRALNVAAAVTAAHVTVAVGAARAPDRPPQRRDHGRVELPAPRRRARRRGRDDGRVGRVGEQPRDVLGAQLQHRALVDVALVGDLPASRLGGSSSRSSRATRHEDPARFAVNPAARREVVAQPGSSSATSRVGAGDPPRLAGSTQASARPRRGRGRRSPRRAARRRPQTSAGAQPPHGDPRAGRELEVLREPAVEHQALRRVLRVDEPHGVAGAVEPSSSKAAAVDSGSPW